MKATLARVLLEDVGLITKAELTFESGLTVFTGETGSGKTMVVGGIGLGLGERASAADIVRTGAQRARVTLEFELDDAARAFFEEEAFPLEPGESAIVEREISATGKSQARLNGRSTTAARVRELLSHFVERIGQHDQQRLLDAREHLMMVDRFGGNDVLALRSRVAQSHAELAVLERERFALFTEYDRGAVDREEAQEALAVIDALAIAPNEDMVLRGRRERLQNTEKITRCLQHAHESLSDDDDAAVSQLGRTVQSLREIERFDPEYAQLASRLLAVQSELSEVAYALSRDLGDEDSVTQELEALDLRLEQIERIKRRYGGSLEGIEAAKGRFREMLASTFERDQRLKSCQDRCRVAAQTLFEDAQRLSRARGEAALRLQKAVIKELSVLAMGSTQFVVQLHSLDQITATGAERIEFMIAANATAALRPISKVASGGELSRMLLALTVVLADGNGASLMIFDEIDTGIGGATATAVGERLSQLAQNVQVISVTHLAQLAAFGDAHYCVRKSSKKALQIMVLALTEHKQVVAEVARMLSGAETEIALKHASDLLQRQHR